MNLKLTKRRDSNKDDRKYQNQQANFSENDYKLDKINLQINLLRYF